MSQLMVKTMVSSPASRKYLILFPFAGGYSVSYRPLSQALRSDWNVLAIEPPGHGSNRAPLVDSIDKLVDLYLEALLPTLTSADSFVLFGHSMGGLITHQLTLRLEKRGILPQSVFISGITPPDVLRSKVSHMDDQEFLDYVVSLGGIPEELLAYPELIELFLPVLRADFRAVETFVSQDRTLLQTPVHMLSGEQDKRCNPQAALAWQGWATNIRFHSFRDGHMFVLSEVQKVAELIDSILNQQAISS